VAATGTAPEHNKNMSDARPPCGDDRRNSAPGAKPKVPAQPPPPTSRRVPWIVAIVVVGLAVLVGGFFLWLGSAGGFSARAKPTGIEAFLARTMRSLALPSRASHRKNPYPPTPAALVTAGEHFAAHCAICHNNNGDGKTMFGENLYPHPPDLRGFTTQDKSDGDLYYTIRNGIRLSGMPAFPDDSPRQTWELVNFIRHLPKITPQELRQMRKYNPKTNFPAPLMPQSKPAAPAPARMPPPHPGSPAPVRGGKR
jgi:mono/diheme cytochrome c family protein